MKNPEIPKQPPKEKTADSGLAFEFLKKRKKDKKELKMTDDEYKLLEKLLTEGVALEKAGRTEEAVEKYSQANIEVAKIQARNKKESGESLITGTTPEGKEVKFELNEQLETWQKFYQKNNIDWIELPKELKA